jgi:2-dehydropantoate 2-reductase
MRILVIGAGATGGYFGGRLLAAGRDISFLVRERRAAQLADEGLLIKSPCGDLRLKHPPTLLASELRQPFDLILLSCKAYDLAAAIESFAPAVGPDTLILPLLNGMAHLDALDARFSRHAVLGGRCLISATLSETGTVMHMNAVHSLTFGERDGGSSTRIDKVRSQLADAGFDAVASPQITQDMWEKWVLLATMAAATCLMRGSVGAILAAPRGKALILQLLDECIDIVASQGHPPAPAYVAQMRAMLTTEGSPLKASMLRDIERHARIEADHVIGDLLKRRPDDLRANPGLKMLEIAFCQMKVYEATLD